MAHATYKYSGCLARRGGVLWQMNPDHSYIQPSRMLQMNAPEDSDSTGTSDGGEEEESFGDEYKFMETSHPLQVLIGLNDLRIGGQFCDVRLCADGEMFAVHKNVMSSFSPYFKAMFTGDMSESHQELVSLSGVEAPMLKMLIDYAYTREMVITKQNVQSLLSAANLLEVLPVRDACCLFLEKHMDASNCVGIHCFAEQHACVDLMTRARAYILKNFPAVLEHDELISLSTGKLVEIIKQDDLEIEKEEQVFKLAIRWLQHNPTERTESFHKVLEEVRLPLLSPYFLHDCVENLDVIRQSEECRKLVNEARLYHLLPDRRSALYCKRTRPRPTTGTTQVIMAVGGEDDKVVLRSVERYDPMSQTWTSLAVLPFAVSKHGLVTSGNNFVYMAGGEFPDGSASKSAWKYDPATDFWWELASMLMPRSELGLAMLDGYVYAVGGWEGTSRLETVERYDPMSNTWEFVAPMKVSLTSPAIVTHEGLIYVTGGAHQEDGDGLSAVQSYDPKTNTWKDLSSMLMPRAGSVACVLNDKIYIIGGSHGNSENTNKVECYIIKEDRWEFKASMIERRFRPGVAVMDQKIYILGGEEGWDRYHDSIECYDPEKDKWELVGDMPTSRSWLSCVPLTLHRQPSSIKKSGSSSANRLQRALNIH